MHKFICTKCGKESYIMNEKNLKNRIEWNIPFPEYKFCSNCAITAKWKEFICDNCGKKFNMTYDQYRRHKNTTLCSQCTNIMSKDKISKSISKLWENPEYKKNQSLSHHLYAISNQKIMSDAAVKSWKNMKNKKIRNINVSKGLKKWHSQRNEDDKLKTAKKISESYNNWLNNLSDEKRKEINNKISEAWYKQSQETINNRIEQFKYNINQWRNNLTDEEKADISKDISDKITFYINSLTNEELKMRIKPMLQDQSKWWDSLSDEKKINKMQDLISEHNKWYDNLTDIEKNKLRKKQLISSSGKNKLHKKFETYFNESYISNDYYFQPEYIVIIENKSKAWDYGIYTKNTNELAMVVDLDGEFYHGDIIDYNGMHSHEEYDEYRFMLVPNNVKYNIIYEYKFNLSFENMVKNLMLDYNEFIQYQFNICRNIPFPYPSYSNIELIKSYNQLCKLKCDDKYHKSISINNREGDRIINHFHHSIYSAKRSSGKYSPYDAWYNDELLKKVIANRMIYINTLNPNKILQGFNIAKIAQKVSVFSAGRAKLLIYKYLLEHDTIFDPFSGFSGRMLGAVSLDKRYVGQDISPIHVNESNKIINYFNLQNKASVMQQNILSSIGIYDCLFTCPPYGDKEQWFEVPADTRSCDDWIDICLNNFKCKKYLFVVDNTEKYKDYIVDEIVNKSHMNKNIEKIILLN